MIFNQPTWAAQQSEPVEVRALIFSTSTGFDVITLKSPTLYYKATLSLTLKFENLSVAKAEEIQKMTTIITQNGNF